MVPGELQYSEVIKQSTQAGQKSTQRDAPTPAHTSTTSAVLSEGEVSVAPTYNAELDVLIGDNDVHNKNYFLRSRIVTKDLK